MITHWQIKSLSGEMLLHGPSSGIDRVRPAIYLVKLLHHATEPKCSIYDRSTCQSFSLSVFLETLILIEYKILRHTASSV